MGNVICGWWAYGDDNVDESLQDITPLPESDNSTNKASAGSNDSDTIKASAEEPDINVHTKDYTEEHEVWRVR